MSTIQTTEIAAVVEAQRVEAIIDAPDVIRAEVIAAGSTATIDVTVISAIITTGTEGPPGPPGADGSWSTMPAPDDLDEADPTFFYFGWANYDGGWMVRRQDRATSAYADATTGAADYASAWAARATLIYG